jgi:hypothetical protein
MGKYRLMCPGCGQRQAEVNFNFTLAISIIMAIVGSVLCRAPATAHNGCTLLYLGTLYLALVFSVVPRIEL